MAIDQAPYVLLDDLSLDLPVYGISNQVLKKELVRFITGGVFSKDKQRKQVHVKALDCVALTITSGMRVGIIGHNGSGKSTLLKVIAGIYEPTGGNLKVQGRVSPLLDLMFGIDPDITGRDNIISRGMIMGHKKEDLLEKIDELIELTGLGGFIEMPVKTYSAGMQVRLAFAVAVLFDPEILVIDEVFGAGDQNFSEKSKGKIVDLIEKAKIFILASHNEEYIKEYCTHVLWLDKGKVRFFGGVQQGLELYKKTKIS